MDAYHEAVAAARLLMRTRQNAVLSTLSAEMDGWPFGSVAPYVLDYAGNPLLLMSDLAQHSRNVRRDARSSLLVWEQDVGDIQKGARATVLGRVAEVPMDPLLRDRYQRYVPDAARYFEIHDFRFYRLEVERVRFIGGFGQIYWIRGQDYRDATDASALWQAEASAVAHMNEDHQEALVRYCAAAGVSAVQPRMLGLDPQGFDVDADGRRLRLSFDTPVYDPSALRAAFIARSAALRGTGPDDVQAPIA